MVHIDWLTVWEQHPQAPDWGDTLRVEIDPLTGEMTREVMLGAQVEESWHTHLRVRSYGGRVEVSGNPSKLGRLEAVVGISDMSEALEVFNGVLRGLGLPEFSVSRSVRLQTSDRFSAIGPRASRVDLTGNLVLGDGAAVRPFFDWLGTQRWGRKGRPFRADPRGDYLNAGTANRRQLVFYDKGEELKTRAADWRRKRCDDKTIAAEYLERCSQWAKSVGLVRQELRLGSKELSETGLCYLVNWQDETVEREYFKRIEVEAMSSDIGCFVNWNADAKAALVAAGESERSAASLVNWVLGWMGGNDPQDGVSRATFYRRAAVVRRVLGVDVRGRPNVLTLGTRVRSMARVIEARPLTEADLPVWYGRPRLRLVA